MLVVEELLDVEELVLDVEELELIVEELVEDEDMAEVEGR